VFDFVEEALDEISVAIEVRAESRDVLAVRPRLDVRPCSSLIEALARFVAVVGPVGQKDPFSTRRSSTRNAPRLVRRQRLDQRPLKIRQIKTSHDNLLKIESRQARSGNPDYRSMS
jgi:hypothetical protein